MVDYRSVSHTPSRSESGRVQPVVSHRPPVQTTIHRGARDGSTRFSRRERSTNVQK